MTKELVQLGAEAPDFTLPAVHREGMVSLADYRGRSPLLLAVFRGLWCPFCRRGIAEFGALSDRLRGAGVESLAVVATDVDNARMYFRHRPTKVPLGADPDCQTHQAYGLPRVPATPEMLAQIQSTPVNPTGDLPKPLPIPEAAQELDRREGFQQSAADRQDQDRQFGQLKGQFLLDRTGIIRWLNVEGATEGVAGFGKFPSADELLRVARLAV